VACSSYPCGSGYLFGVVIETEGGTMPERRFQDTDPPFVARLDLFDAHGALAVNDNPITWAVDDETVATAAANDDGQSCTVTPGSPGEQAIANATLTATTTNGDGAAIVATAALVCTATEAVTGVITFP
jgi:hypothetical protein